MKTFTKDPDAILDYSVDWSSWLLPGEQIAEAAWEVTGGTGLELGTGDRSANHDETSAWCWLSGGTVDTGYTVRCRVTTTASPARVDDRSFRVSVQER
ncbi:MAG TPA: hypothetical protein VLC09_20170 [Polyangiaceae bacterium]|nr:hypothetical protein [Polyangiaceae bacterium]